MSKPSSTSSRRSSTNVSSFLFADPQFHVLKEYVHFCCTSEDINNIAYSLLLSDAKDAVLVK